MVFLLKNFPYLCLMINIEQIDNLIEKSEQKTTLLKELKESAIYESKIYNLIKMRMGSKDFYMLYLISNKQEVISGELDRIKSHLRLHKIDISDIYSTFELTNI